MLAAVLFYVALIALVAATVLSAGLAMTRMTIARTSQSYLAAGYDRAVASLQETIAQAMQSGGSAHPMPVFTPLPPACADAACTYRTQATIVLLQSAASPGPSCDPAASNCAPNVQTNAYVGESRLTAAIAVNVEDRAGAVLASRSGKVVVRTMNVPPYAAVGGARDDAFDDVSASHALGDDGGVPPATPNPCAGAGTGVAGDTTVRVAYRNAVSHACSDGNSWGSASYDVH
jgi:hypothetical protein